MQMVVMMNGKAVMREDTPFNIKMFKEFGYEILKTGLSWNEAERISKDYNILQERVR